MKLIEIIPWLLIVAGAIINFIVPIVLKKNSDADDAVMNKIYITKSTGLVLVIIGCVMIFWLGGKFGV